MLIGNDDSRDMLIFTVMDQGGHIAYIDTHTHKLHVRISWLTPFQFNDHDNILV